MKQEKKQDSKVLGILALAVMGVLGVSLVSAYGMGFGFGKGELTNEEISEMQEHHEAMKEAIQNKDYATWEALMQERLAGFEDGINEETFEEIYNRHIDMEEFHEAVEELKESGDFSREKMLELREEYGIEGKGMHRGSHTGFGQGMMSGSGGCPYA